MVTWSDQGESALSPNIKAPTSSPVLYVFLILDSPTSWWEIFKGLKGSWVDCLTFDANDSWRSDTYVSSKMSLNILLIDVWYLCKKSKVNSVFCSGSEFHPLHVTLIVFLQFNCFLLALQNWGNYSPKHYNDFGHAQKINMGLKFTLEIALPGSWVFKTTCKSISMAKSAFHLYNLSILFSLPSEEL